MFQNSEHDTAIAELQASTSSKEEIIARMKNDASEKDASLLSLNENMDRLHQQLSTLQSDFTQKSSEFHELQQLNTQLQDQVCLC